MLNQNQAVQNILATLTLKNNRQHKIIFDGGEVRVNNKFLEFYYEVDKEVYPINHYWDLYDKNHQEAISKYEGHMFCPLCELAPITVAKGEERRYFKVDRTNMQKHDIQCSYRLKMGSKNETNEFYKDLDKTDIKNRLRSCMNKMLKNRKKGKGEQGEKNNSIRNSQDGFLDFLTKGNVKKYLPHKNFTVGTLSEDLDIQKIFYGKCCLYILQYILEGEDEVKRYYLKVLDHKSKRQIFDIAIPTYVYKYLKAEFDDIPVSKSDAKNYYLCFSGIMQKNKYSYNSRLTDSRLILFEEDMGEI